MFGAGVIVVEEPVKLYTHGYTPEEVEHITQKKKLLEKRNLVEEPVTLDEFRSIIIPFQRIQRTEIFNLNPEKEKKVRVLKEKVVKVKKLTKKQINDEVTRIVFKRINNEELTEEEDTFLQANTTKIGI